MNTALAALLETETTRCLGCGAALPGTTWEPHGTACRPYYGAGRRVSYALWSAHVDSLVSEPLFDRWADGVAQAGIPSRSDGTERVR